VEFAHALANGVGAKADAFCQVLKRYTSIQLEGTENIAVNGVDHRVYLRAKAAVPS
jgi:hypothetical protein